VKRLPAQDDLGALDRINRRRVSSRVGYGTQVQRRIGTTGGSSVRGGNVCFRELVKLYSGDAPVRAVLDELMRVGIIERTPTERFACSNGVHPRTGEIDKIASSAATRRTLSRRSITISASGCPFFQRKVSYDNLPSEALPELKKLAGEQSQALLELLDRWMSERDRDANPRLPGTAECGQGSGSTISKRTTKEISNHEPQGQTVRLLVGVLLLVLASLTFSTCGGQASIWQEGSQRHRRQHRGHHQFRQRRDVRRALPNDNNTIRMSHGMDHSSEMDRVAFGSGWL